MAGMIGMAQTLAVYTLKNRQVQSHDPTFLPSDVAAVLEWGLDMPFTSQDKPPLAIAMIATLNGERSFRRYRLVIAQKAKFCSQLWLKPLSVQTLVFYSEVAEVDLPLLVCIQLLYTCVSGLTDSLVYVATLEFFAVF